MDETQVFVGPEINAFCELESISSTQIKCRTITKDEFTPSDNNVVTVFSKLIQEAVCSGTCLFSYTDESTAASLTSSSATSIEEGD